MSHQLRGPVFDGYPAVDDPLDILRPGRVTRAPGPTLSSPKAGQDPCPAFSGSCGKPILSTRIHVGKFAYIATTFNPKGNE